MVVAKRATKKTYFSDFLKEKKPGKAIFIQTFRIALIC